VGVYQITKFKTFFTIKMVWAALILLLNLFHLGLGTFGVVFTTLVLVSVIEQLDANLNDAALVTYRNYLAAAVAAAGLGWLLLTIGGPLGGPSALRGDGQQLKLLAGLGLAAFVLYAVGGSIVAYVYTLYPEPWLVWAEVLLLITSVVALGFGVATLLVGRWAADGKMGGVEDVGRTPEASASAEGSGYMSLDALAPKMESSY
jgi:hypothetical protein